MRYSIWIWLLGVFLTSSIEARLEEKSDSDPYSEQELHKKDQEIRVAAFKTGCQVAGTAAAVALTPPPANLLVGAAGACAVHDSYQIGKEAENDLAAMQAHNARLRNGKNRDREFSRDQRSLERSQRFPTLRCRASRPPKKILSSKSSSHSPKIAIAD